ncbi:MAG: putative collagen-binding domain-containing protein, partial [Pseudomonadota bacterium]
TNTVAGDGQDVSPWVDEDLYKVDKHTKSIEAAAGNTSGVSTDAFSVYDVSKLDQWETVFDHMDDKGIYKNILFQETENDQLLNGGTSVEGSTLSVERLVYMREMIARFGHANGVQWNMGEENTQDDDERLDMANWIKAVDPYDHLVVIHTFGSDYDDVYGSLLGDEAFDGPSFQTGAGSIRNLTTEWREDSAANGDPWVIAWDEDSGNNAKVTAYETDADNQNEQTLREGMWGHLTAGGSGVNWYLKGNGFGGHSFDQNLDDFEGFESIWTWTRAATEFYNDIIPFWEMTQNDGLTPDGGDFVSAKAGEYYVAYRGYGQATDVEFDLAGQGGETFDVFWYDPRNGGDLIADGQVQGGGIVDIGDAPTATGKDWVVMLRNADLDGGTVTPPPPPPPSDTGAWLANENGHFVIEAESAIDQDLAGGWTFHTTADLPDGHEAPSGGGYIEAATNNFGRHRDVDDHPNSLLTYEFLPEKDGYIRINLVASHEGNPTEENDTWVGVLLDGEPVNAIDQGGQSLEEKGPLELYKAFSSGGRADQ